MNATKIRPFGGHPCSTNLAVERDKISQSGEEPRAMKWFASMERQKETPALLTLPMIPTMLEPYGQRNPPSSVTSTLPHSVDAMAIALIGTPALALEQQDLRCRQWWFHCAHDQPPLRWPKLAGTGEAPGLSGHRSGGRLGAGCGRSIITIIIAALSPCSFTFFPSKLAASWGFLGLNQHS